jgi:hypothetical protein
MTVINNVVIAESWRSAMPGISAPHLIDEDFVA